MSTSYYKTEGLVFRIQDQFEADRMFSVFTKDFGRLEILGRAIRKIDSKLRGGIDIFSLSRIEFIQGRNQKTLTDAVAQERFKNIYDSPEKLAIAYKVSNVIDDFIKGQEPDENIFNLVNEIFSKLNNYQLSTTLPPHQKFHQNFGVGASYQLLYYYFLWNFIAFLGYRPELFVCAFCQQKLNPYGLYFSKREGGIICKDCFNKKREGIKVNSSLVKILRLLIRKDWATVSRLKINKEIQQLLDGVSEIYYQYLISHYSSKNVL